MSQRASGYDRMPDEEYNTPSWVADAVAPFLKRLRVHSVWEPCPGAGQLAFALKDNGFELVATKSNFFTYSGMPLPKLDCICTNPPYGPPRGGDQAALFIRTALGKPVRVIAMLLRTDFDHAKTRVDIFRDCSSFAGRVVLLDRIKWFPGESSPSENHSWFLWDKETHTRPWIAYAGKENNARF